MIPQYRARDSQTDQEPAVLPFDASPGERAAEIIDQRTVDRSPFPGWTARPLDLRSIEHREHVLGVALPHSLLLAAAMQPLEGVSARRFQQAATDPLARGLYREQ